MARKLLVVDDDEISCRLIRAIFQPEGFVVSAAHDGPSGLERLAAEAPDVVILDWRLPGISGLEVLTRIRDAHPQLPILILTAHGDVKSAVQATQLGAFDYLTKPVDHEEVRLVVRRALEARALQIEVEELRRQLGAGAGLSAQMGPSTQVRAIIDQVVTVAASNFTVMILGETGTGKELVAQAVHRKSERRSKPFMALDCGAIPEALLESELFGHERGAFSGAERRRDGRFQLAEGGTFFLDEIGNMPLMLQAKLLRVLESRQVQALGSSQSRSLDVRFVAATNVDLQARVHSGAFRADLYFRLSQYTVTLPPLRERPADIAYLAQRFLDEVSLELRKPVQKIVPNAQALLDRHSWPGNVRELRNVIRQAVLTTKDLVIREQDLDGLSKHGFVQAPPSVPREAGKSLRQIADEAARAAERQAICDTLRFTKGNKSHAAKVLKTDYKTLHVKMKQLGIVAREFNS